MKKHIPIFLLFIISHSTAQVTFQKRISSLSSSQTALAIASTSDSGYVIGGSALVPFSTGDVFTMKVSSLGSIIWTNIFSGSNDGAAYDIIEANDGGIISTGYYAYPGAGNNVFLQKTDSAGGFVWMKMYGANLSETGFAVRQLSDEGFIIAGFTRSLTGSNDDIYLIRTDSSGTMSWNKTYSSCGGHERANSIAVTADGGYIMTGRTTGFGAQGQDLILIKTDSAGDVTWSEKFGTALDEEGYSVQQTADGGFVVAGVIGVSGGKDALLLKTDNSGNLLWTKKYHYMNENYSNKVIVTPGGQLVLTGYCSPSGINGSKFLTIMTDTAGSVIWSKTYGGTSGDVAYGVQRADDGGFIMTGFGDLYANILIVKTDSTGESGCFDSSIAVVSDTTQLVAANAIYTVLGVGAETSFTPSNISSGNVATVCLNFVGEHNAIERPVFSVYPNPANDQIRLEYSGFDDKYSVTIFNSLGRKVIHLPATQLDQLVIDTKMLPSGIYIINVNSGRGSFTKKFIVAR